MKKSHLALWAVLILFVIALYQMFAGPAPSSASQVPLGEVLARIRRHPGDVTQLVVRDGQWEIAWRDGTRARTLAPPLDGALLVELGEIPIEISPVENSLMTLVVGSWLPMLAWFFAAYYVLRRASRRDGDAAALAALQARIARLEAELATRNPLV